MEEREGERKKEKGGKERGRENGGERDGGREEEREGGRERKGGIINSQHSHKLPKLHITNDVILYLSFQYEVVHAQSVSLILLAVQ